MPKAKKNWDKFRGDRGRGMELCNCRKFNGRAQQQQSSRQKRERGETYVATLERRIASVYIAGRGNGVHIYVMMESTDACETKEHMQNELVFKRRIDVWFYFCLIVCQSWTSVVNEYFSRRRIAPRVFVCFAIEKVEQQPWRFFVVLFLNDKNEMSKISKSRKTRLSYSRKEKTK